ncbi:MAG: polyhydroxyalkanoic acid system family protein [Porticoccaceae bacterium]|nr:polyhydroxyalkanoic acid system family protein [Porticoccaceae bacterium]
MATVYVERDHQLNDGQLKELGELLAAKLTSKLGGSASWQGNELHYKQSGASACAQLGDKKVTVNVELGLLMSGFAPMVKSEVERILDKYLDAQA